MRFLVYVLVYLCISFTNAFIQKYNSIAEYTLNREHTNEICHEHDKNNEVMECHDIPFPFPINNTHYIYVTANNEYMVNKKIFAVSKKSTVYIFKHKDESKISTFLKGLYEMK